jgi:hypothetical protein
MYLVQSLGDYGVHCPLCALAVGVSSGCWIQLHGKCVWNASPFNVLTLDIATNDNSAENSFSPKSITTSLRVSPWLL